jgi:tetratricopeptide (TPR) repeat protein
LADAAGVTRSEISLYEGGHRIPRADTLVRVIAATGLSRLDFERLRMGLRSASPPKDHQPESESLEEPTALAAEVADAVSDTVLLALRDIPSGLLAREDASLPAAADREPAPGRCARLLAQKPAKRRLLVEGTEEFRSWAVAELLCEQSERAAADSAERALELAELARFVAERTPGGEVWRLRLQGYAWAFIGNARRVGGDLRGADRAFAQARTLWEAGAAALPGLLDAARLLDLEASLRRAQRRFAEAIELLDRALAASTVPSTRAGCVLLKKAFTYEQMGDCEGAITALERAASFVDGKKEPRSLFALRFNLAVNLCHLERYAEAAPLVAQARELAIELRNDLDLSRVLWLEARVLAGLGRRTEAIAALRQVRDDFAARGHAYDAALATLNLAVLLLEDGRTAEVQALAREMVPIFESLGIDREALAAVRLFSQAGQQAAATAELARRLLRFLERARHDPALRFAT